MKKEQEITKELFNEIYTNDKLRHAVAYAHGCCDSEGRETHRLALYGLECYVVTESQILEAKTVHAKIIAKVLRDNKNNLLFVGMGMDFEPTIKDGVGNYRIRTEFLNSKGKKYFIEFGKGMNFDELRIDFAIDRDMQNECGDAHNKQSLFYNYHKLETKTPALKYTYQNVLKLVNKHFNCNFKKMVVDSYNISHDGVLCESL